MKNFPLFSSLPLLKLLDSLATPLIKWFGKDVAKKDFENLLVDVGIDVFSEKVNASG